MPLTPCHTKSVLTGVVLSLFIGACTNTTTSDHDAAWPFPVSEDSIEQEPVTLPKDYIRDDVERWQKQHASVVYGEVVRVEPVLDRLNEGIVDNEYVYVDDCQFDGRIRLALRVQFRPLKASWPLNEGETITVGLEYFRFSSPPYTATPFMDTSDKEIEWTDHQDYFRVGSHVAIVGMFDKDGIYRAFDPLFMLDDDEQILLPPGWFDRPWADEPFDNLVRALKLSREEVDATVYETAQPMLSVCPFREEAATSGDTWPIIKEQACDGTPGHSQCPK